MEAFPFSLTCAWGLDLILGDPRWLPHPVRGLGWIIARLERFVRAAIHREELAGGVLVFLVAAGTLAIVETSLRWAFHLAEGLGRALEVAWIYVCLSTRDLAEETWPVFRALRAGDLVNARRYLRAIVGRDVEDLDESEVVRASLETVAESTMDGIVAPLFYAALGGAPWACLYKAVNTLDSMVGLRTPRYVRFGKPVASLDRWMNAIPAWITAGLILMVGIFQTGRIREGLRAIRPKAVRRQNGFLVEAAMGGVLGVRLGGWNRYQGQLVLTPHLGLGSRPLDRSQIPEALRIMWKTSCLAFLLAFAMRWGLALWGGTLV